MNWRWSIRSGDGGMNGLEFALCTTAGGFSRALVHAAPAKAQVEIHDDEGALVARGDLDREDDYSPMTLLDIDIDAATVRRSEVWPDPGLLGTPVLLAGGEVGMLRAWEHADDHSWWRWSAEFSNHTGRPPDWAPPDRA